MGVITPCPTLLVKAVMKMKGRGEREYEEGKRKRVSFLNGKVLDKYQELLCLPSAVLEGPIQVAR